MKKKTLALLLTLCMMLSVLPFGAAAADFTDVESGAYYEEAVYWAVYSDPQITNGVDPTHFAPNNVCTRDQVVTFLWRAFGQPQVGGANPFSDVRKDDYFYDAVLWANATGVTNGIDPTHFGPKSACTRGQVATFLWRAMGKPETSISSPFTDVKKGEYYDQAVLWAYETGVTNGTSATTFSPDAACTRGQIVTFLFRAMNRSNYWLLVSKEITKYGDDESGYIWTYDSHGRNIRMETLDGMYWEEFTFDGDRVVSGKNWEGRVWTPESDYEYDESRAEEVYDENGFLVKYIYHDDNGDYVTVFQNDDRGNTLESVTTGPDGVVEKNSYTYDPETGYRLTSHYERTEGGEVYWNDYEFTYDEYGNEIKTVMTNSYGEKEVSNIEYVFDESGFLVKTVTSTDYTENGQTHSYVTTREFIKIEDYNMIGWGERFYPHFPLG